MKNLSAILAILFLALVSCNKEEVKKRVLEYGTLTDIDGNTYKTVKIGEQWWMCENLKVSRYSDGSSINFISNLDSSWATTTSGSYSFVNTETFGSLYNQAAVQDARSLAPTGWHIPSDEEWKVLEREIGMSAVEANHFAWRGTNQAELLIKKNSEGWPNGTIPFGLDEVAFSVIPAGCRLFNGEITSGYNAFFWTATIDSNSNAFYRNLDYKKKSIFRQTTYPQYGMSIRCVKN